MENPTSFDLNFAIKHWRSALEQSPAMQGEDLDELESHMREAVGDLRARGLSEEEAVLIAARRLGWAETLVREFDKVNVAVVWRDRAVWMLAGTLFFVTGWDLSRMTEAAIIYFGSLTAATGLSLGWFGVVAKSVSLGSVASLFWLMATGRVSRWNTGSTWLRQHPVGCATILLGGVVTLKIVASAFEMLLIRNLGPQAIGQTYAVTMWFNAFSPAIAMVAMIVLFARLLSGRVKNTGGIRVAAWMLGPFMAMSLLASPARAQANYHSVLSAVTVVADKKDSATLDDAMKLWSAGKKDDAMATFLTVDFSRRPLFPVGSALNYSEAQFIALPQTAREKLSQQMLEDIHLLKEIGVHVRNAGKAASAAADKARSDQCNTKLQQCGDAFDQPDSLALLKLMGKALKKMAAGTSGPAK